MSDRRRRTELVELVEEAREPATTGPTPTGVTPAGPTEHAPSAARRPRRRLRVAIAGTAALALAVLVALQADLDRRDREAQELLDDVPGLLRPLDRRVEVLWQTTGAAGAGAGVGLTIQGSGVRDVRGPVVVGRDPGTGEARWETALPATWASAAARSTACRVPDGLVLCTSRRGDPPGAAATWTDVIVIDPADGELLAEHTVPPDTAWTTSDGLLVVATADAGGAPPAGATTGGRDVTWTVTATSLADGALAWRSTLPTVRRVDRLVPRSDELVLVPALDARDGRVLVSHSGHAWLLGANGALLDDVGTGVDGWAELGPDGTLVWSPGDQPADIPGVLVTAGGSRVRVHEVLLPPAVDDGSVPGVLVLRDAVTGALVVRDTRTGDELWRTRDAIGAPVLLGGRLLSGTVAGAAAWDARTGAELWARRVGRGPLFVGTDGRDLVVLGYDRHVRGLGLDDGRTVWDAGVVQPLDDGRVVERVDAWAGRILVRLHDGTDVVVG